MQKLPLVSVIMPCYNEEAYIEECVESVLSQDYPSDRVEILICDGRSTDGTRSILEGLAAKDPRIRVIDNPDKLQSAGMNEALRVARGAFIARMDVHAKYANDYLRRCAEVIEETGADNVGGAARPKARTPFQRALAAALNSPLAVGGSKYRSEKNEGFVETVWPGFFRRRVFETAGLYDRRAVTNEDAELNQRLLELGRKIFMSRKIVVHYFPRDSMKALARQYFSYGKGRARTLLKHKKFPTLRPAVPFLMVVGGAALVMTSHIQPFTPYVIALYAAATGVEAIRVGYRAGLSSIPIVWAIFPVLHISHGVGFAAGLIHYALHPDWAPTSYLPTSN